MRKVPGFFALILCALGLGLSVQAQGNDPAITATRVFGKITEINAPAGEMIVKTDAGSVVAVKLNEKTTYERMPAGETDRSKAVAIALTDVTVGDGVYVKGYVAEDRKSIPAQKVTIVSQSDIAKRQDKERAEWRERGINGVIAALNPQAKEITITTRTAAGPAPVIIPVTDKVWLRRYAPDSIKFSEAKKSSWDELKVGDQLRAKGERSADGTRFTPEEIVTGSFRTIGGAITSVDAASSEIKISDIQNQQPLTVAVRKDSTLKRIPPEMLQMMAGGQGGATTSPSGGGAGAGGGFDIQRLIDNLPATTLADLKPGDMILLLSTTGADPTRVTAITLVSGVQPIFAMLQARQGAANRPPNLGTINLGIGGP